MKILYLEVDPDVFSSLSSSIQQCGVELIQVLQPENVVSQLYDQGFVLFVILSTEACLDRRAVKELAKRIRDEFPKQVVFGTSNNADNKRLFADLGLRFIDKSRLSSEVPRLLDCVGGSL